MANKKKNTLVKDTLILALITLIAGVSLSVVHEITAPLIEEKKIAAQAEAFKVVYPSAEKFVSNDTLKEAEKTSYSSKEYGDITVNEIFAVADSSGNEVGHVISVTTPNGYAGNITLSLGYSNDGTMTGMEILESGETPGFGAKAGEPAFKGQFSGKKADFIVVGGGENGIEGITGATITTNAVTKAINAGLEFIQSLK